MSAAPSVQTRSKAWPEPAQFNEAVQNLAVTMSDPELQAGEAELNPLGLPMPYSGNFADVYKVHCPQTGNTWAVKFFKREVRDLHHRYSAISGHLSQVQLPFMVDFRYLEEGVRIGGQWYPLVKMRWIEGLSLNRFVAQSLGDPRLLDLLFDLWVKLAARLRDAGMAHADLQHGNVVLVPESSGGRLLLKLIDYDGMYVPALAGQNSGELGHANYQHPQREVTRAFGPELDRFSHLAICCALRCLSVGGRPLWERFNSGENLLFTARDFAEPGSSKLFRELWTLRDAQARALVGHLVLAAHRELDRTPLLADLMQDGRVRPLNAAERHYVIALLGGELDQEQIEPPPLPETETQTLPAEDIEPPPIPVPQRESSSEPGYFAQWLSIVLLALIVVVLALGWVSGAFSTAAIVIAAAAGGIVVTVALWRGYRSLPERQLLQQAVAELEIAELRWQSKQGEWQLLSDEVPELEQALAEVQEDYLSLPRRLLEAKAEAQRNVEEQRKTLGIKRLELSEQESEALRLSEAELERMLKALQDQLAAIVDQEGLEVRRALQQLQLQHVANAMRGAKLVHAVIHDIDATSKARLLAARFESADDVMRRDVRVVAGISESGVLALHRWAELSLGQAQRSAPQALPDLTWRAISARYAAQRTHVQTQIDDLDQWEAARRQQIVEGFATKRQELSVEFEALADVAKCDSAALDHWFELERIRLTHGHVRLHGEIHEKTDQLPRRQAELRPILEQAAKDAGLARQKVTQLQSLVLSRLLQAIWLPNRAK